MAKFHTEWLEKPANPKFPPKVVEAIARRRRQMLIHCYLYYGMDESIVPDHRWNKWAQQLAQLQVKYTRKIGFYDSLFRDWDGSSGFHLQTNKGVDHNVVRVAERVLQVHRYGLCDVLQTKAGRDAIENYRRYSI